ncbi:MAG: DUF4388 domain-containing protein [Myxococcota bacterium]
MTKQNLLVVDADPRSLRVLEVSLRNAGYNVAGCPSVGKAFEILHTNKPDLILSDTAFSDMDGFEFVEQLRQNPEWSRIPFMYLSSDETIESKIRGLELGVQDYLTKPIYIREVVARVGIELARQAREGLAQRTDDAKTRFSGSLAEMSVVDLLQTIDVSRKSGVLNLKRDDGDQGMISFDSGAVIHAAVEDLGGEDAVYRLLLWRDGSFDLEFRKVSLVERTVHRTTQALLMEGMRRLDEWSRLSELLPPFHIVLEVDGEVLRERLHDIPDDQNIMVRLIDGRRTIGAAIQAHRGDHVEALRKLVDLYFEGIVREVGEVKDSIPILAQAKKPVSSLPPKAAIDTIPGPGPKPSLTPIAVPSLGSLPVTELAPSSSPAVVPVSLPPASAVPNVESEGAARPASDLVPTPESLPSPDATHLPPPSYPEEVGPSDAEGKAEPEIWVPASQPPTVMAPASGSEADALAGWAPAPPPDAEPRKNTPGGFQAAQGGGGTILNWAGRIPDDIVQEQRDPQLGGAAESPPGDWDKTLDELREDPEVAEAIAVIDSEPPPGPFVRSSPPPAAPEPEGSASEEVDARVAAASSDQNDRETVEYHEPPDADPPPLTYGQVFEGQLPSRKPASPPTASADARKPAAHSSDAVSEDSRRLMLLAIAAAVVVATVVVLSGGPEAVEDVERRVGEAAMQEAETVSGAAIEEEREPSDAESALVEREGVEAYQAKPSAESPSFVANDGPDRPTLSDRDVSRGSEPPGAAPAMRKEDGTPATYPKTGALDTYDAQLAQARKLKRGSRATAAYRRAIELNPEGGAALAELARLELGREHAREAAELSERATAIDPTNALAWVVLGAARQVRGDRQGARQAYRNCVKFGKGRYVSECRAMLP